MEQQTLEKTSANSNSSLMGENEQPIGFFTPDAHKSSPGTHKYSWNPHVATIKQLETGVGRVSAQLPKQSTRNDTNLIQCLVDLLFKRRSQLAANSYCI